MAAKILTTPRHRPTSTPTVFMCRWPDGTVSVVAGRDRAAARETLEEFGSCDLDMLEPLPDLLIDFRVDADGRLTLSDIGENCGIQIETALGIAHDIDDDDE